MPSKMLMMAAAVAVRALGSLFTSLFGELVAPSRCASCDVSVGARVLFCPPCASSVEKLERTTGGCIAAFQYGGALATAIARLKYEDRPDLAPRFGRSMLASARRIHGAVDLVVPVPLHPRRLAERGYNQAALLASPIARSLEVRMAPRALVRLRDTPKQTSLDRSARRTNLRGAFSAREPGLIRGSRVLLIDDVRTTGSTLEACATALHEVGARQVLALVLARA